MEKAIIWTGSAIIVILLIGISASLHNWDNGSKNETLAQEKGGNQTLNQSLEKKEVKSMNFTIKEVEQKGNTLQVVFSDDNYARRVISFPIEMAKDNQYIAEIQRILNEEANAQKIEIDKSVIGKEMSTDANGSK